MKKRIRNALCVMVGACLTMAAQTELVLSALSMRHDPWLTRQARVEGVVKVAFTLQPQAKEPTKVEIISASTLEGTAAELLKTAAVESVKTWRFQNVDPIEHRYVTRFDFQIAGEDEVVSFQSFHHVTVESSGGKLISN